MTDFISMRECRRRARYVRVLSREFKNIVVADTKKHSPHHADHGGIIGIFFQPILLNDSSKEPHGSDDIRTVVPEK